MWESVFVYILLMNMISFVLMKIDKNRAIRREWRIAEKILFLFALIGGSVGVLVGMFFFHHKTRHVTFVYGIPALIFGQTAFLYWIYAQ